jgi:hypothetical protein
MLFLREMFHKVLNIFKSMLIFLLMLNFAAIIL